MKAILVTLISILSLSRVSIAGVSTSGGGFAVVCRNAEGRIQSAELLDLYEARMKLGFHLMKPTGNLREDYILALKRSFALQGGNPFYPNYSNSEIEKLTTNIDYFFGMVTFFAPNEDMGELIDIGETISAPKGCQYEQIAIFHDDHARISLKSEVWSSLDSLNQAALVEHELHYFSLRRDFGQKTSQLARLWVAHEFSADPLKSVTADLPNENVLKCQSDEDQANFTAFFLYRNPKTSKFTLQFYRLGNYPMAAKSKIELDQLAQNQAVPLQATFNLGWSIGVQKIVSGKLKVSIFEKDQLIASVVTSCQPR